MDELLSLLRSHLAAHPAAGVRDAVKFIYQNEFGGGHLISDPAAAFARLEDEFAACPPSDEPLYEPLGNGLVRLNLYPASKLFSLQTVFNAFCRSSRALRGSMDVFREKLSLLASLPFSSDEREDFIGGYISEGCPAVSHSESYRAAYSPHYRVVGEGFVRYAHVFAAVDRLAAHGRPLTVGIDGMCASGKTTLAAMLGEIYDCNVFHADDYFLPAEMRTAERLSEIGGNMHRERLAKEILLPLSRGEAVTARPFLCGSMTYGDWTEYPKRRINIVEGSYCLHPDLRPLYGLTVAVKTESGIQLSRIEKRDPSLAKIFAERWIPMENRYFETTELFSRADVTVNT